MDLPLVTVGVASFNNAGYLRETLESIRLQTYTRLELLIVDDASRDDSVMVAEAWLAEHPEVNGRLIRHTTNLGVCRVCNDIITEAQGEFVTIIGSDDVYLPDKFAIQVPLLQIAPPTVGILFSPIERMNEAGHPLPDTGEAHHEGQVFMDLLNVNFISAMGTLMRRSCYERVGLYDETLAYEDWDMWLRMAREYEFQFSPRVSARYRIHAGSATFSRRMQLAESSLQLLEKHIGLVPAADAIISRHFAALSEALYLLGSPRAIHWLAKAWRLGRGKRTLVLLLMARMGIPLSKAHQLNSFLRRHESTAS